MALARLPDAPRGFDETFFSSCARSRAADTASDAGAIFVETMLRTAASRIKLRHAAGGLRLRRGVSASRVPPLTCAPLVRSNEDDVGGFLESERRDVAQGNESADPVG